MVGGAAALATPLLPEEGESASFPKDATLKFLRKHAGPEWSKIPEESKENVLKWATKDPLKVLGINSPIPNEYDRSLINTALNSPYVYDINPEIFNQTRIAQAVIPDEVLSGVNPKFTLINPALHKKGHYQNSRGFGGGEVGYNPATVGLTTPAHEIGAHGSQDILKFRNDYDKSTLLSLDAGKELQKEYHDLVRGAPFKASQIYSDDLKNNPAFKGYLKEIFDTYKNLPDEVAANEVGSYFESGLLNKDYKNLRNYDAFKDVFSSATKDAFRNYRETFPEKGKKIYDSIKNSGKYLATPFALGAGLTAYDMQDPQEGEAAPVTLENIFRGGKKTKWVDGKLTYPIQDRAAFRVIDNPIGAGYFGDVFNVKLNMKNLFDPRYDPEAIFPIAKQASERGIMSERDSIKNLSTGNWDALELGEDNYSGQVGKFQQLLLDAGFSGNHQLEPTHFKKNKWNELQGLVPRRYQDVYQTFDKGELSIGDNAFTRYGIEDLFGQRGNESKLKANLPEWYQGIATPDQGEGRLFSKNELVKPITLYNGEPLKQFHPLFKDVLEEFRPDAHYLDDSYENRQLFPPSNQAFSLQDMREKYQLGNLNDSWSVASSKKSNTKIEEDKILEKLNGLFDTDYSNLKNLMTHTNTLHLNDLGSNPDTGGFSDTIKTIAEQIKETGNDKIFKKFKDTFGNNLYSEHFGQSDEIFPSVESMGLSSTSDPSQFFNDPFNHPLDTHYTGDTNFDDAAQTDLDLLHSYKKPEWVDDYGYPTVKSDIVAKHLYENTGEDPINYKNFLNKHPDFTTEKYIKQYKKANDGDVPSWYKPEETTIPKLGPPDIEDLLDEKTKPDTSKWSDGWGILPDAHTTAKNMYYGTAKNSKVSKEFLTNNPDFTLDEYLSKYKSITKGETPVWYEPNTKETPDSTYWGAMLPAAAAAGVAYDESRDTKADAAPHNKVLSHNTEKSIIDGLKSSTVNKDGVYSTVKGVEDSGISRGNTSLTNAFKKSGKYLPDVSDTDGIIGPSGNLIASALGSIPGMAWDLAKQYGGTMKKVFTGSPIDSEDTRNLLDIATLPINAIKGNAALAGISVLWPDNKEFDENKMVKEGITYPANFIPRKDARGKVLIDVSKLNFDPLGQAMMESKQYETAAGSFFE